MLIIIILYILGFSIIMSLICYIILKLHIKNVDKELQSIIPIKNRINQSNLNMYELNQLQIDLIEFNKKIIYPRQKEEMIRLFQIIHTKIECIKESSNLYIIYKTNIKLGINKTIIGIVDKRNLEITFNKIISIENYSIEIYTKSEENYNLIISNGNNYACQKIIVNNLII